MFVWVDAAPDDAQDTSWDAYRDVSHDALLTAKDETIAALREQLAQANERDRENRRIIAALTARIPAIEASQEARETPVGSSEGSSGGDLPSQTEEPVEARPWWRRMFGG